MANGTAGSGGEDGRAEVGAWYVRDLRPKLAVAARRRSISRGQAEALDRLMRELLDLRPAGRP
jgi:hypothetical protein